jgi:hypothetical protein
MVGVGMPAALEVRRQRIRRVCDSGGIGVRKPCLPSVRSRHPPEHVIEGPVFHHDHDDVVDTKVFRARQLLCR